MLKAFSPIDTCLKALKAYGTSSCSSITRSQLFNFAYPNTTDNSSQRLYEAAGNLCSSKEEMNSSGSYVALNQHIYR